MSKISWLMTLAAVAALSGTGLSQETSGDRGFFVRSRPTTSGQAARKPRPRSKPATTSRVRPVNPPEKSVTIANRLAIGYSLFKERPGTAPLRVAPDTPFRDGDAVRIVVEPGTDGYVYVFATENGQNAVMLYPDARLDDGANAVAAHQLVEIPSSRHPQFQWFRLNGGPAVEQIVLVFSAEPLDGVPVGETLVAWCASNGCPWKPNVDVWTLVSSRLSARKDVSVARATAEAQTGEEADAISRSLVLSAAAPEPAVITSAGDGGAAIATKIEIRHERE